jgi:hypothetical protein
MESQPEKDGFEQAERLQAAQEYRPELLSRRGEFVAWSLAVIVNSTWLVLILADRDFPGAVSFFAVFLLAVALSISLGNWMDRRTVLRLNQEEIIFDNGLRHARLRYEDIRQVQVFPSAWGNKVRVIGTQAHFDFRTLGEVKVQGEVKGRMGFPEGEQILKRILEMAQLKKVGSGGKTRYYARE